VIAMGVDLLQGYHQSPPMPGDQVEEWVREWNGRSMIVGGSTPERQDWRGTSAS
jgi:hypothetical protein